MPVKIYPRSHTRRADMLAWPATSEMRARECVRASSVHLVAFLCAAFRSSLTSPSPRCHSLMHAYQRQRLTSVLCHAHSRILMCSLAACKSTLRQTIFRAHGARPSPDLLACGPCLWSELPTCSKSFKVGREEHLSSKRALGMGSRQRRNKGANVKMDRVVLRWVNQAPGIS